jgi:hypothetical protein
MDKTVLCCRNEVCKGYGLIIDRSKAPREHDRIVCPSCHKIPYRYCLLCREYVHTKNMNKKHRDCEICGSTKKAHKYKKHAFTPICPAIWLTEDTPPPTINCTAEDPDNFITVDDLLYLSNSSPTVNSMEQAKSITFDSVLLPSLRIVKINPQHGNQMDPIDIYVSIDPSPSKLEPLEWTVLFGTHPAYVRVIVPHELNIILATSAPAQHDAITVVEVVVKYKEMTANNTAVFTYT